MYFYYNPLLLPNKSNMLTPYSYWTPTTIRDMRVLSHVVSVNSAVHGERAFIRNDKIREISTMSTPIGKPLAERQPPLEIIFT